MIENCECLPSLDLRMPIVLPYQLWQNDLEFFNYSTISWKSIINYNHLKLDNYYMVDDQLKSEAGEIERE